jgi:hypothetical protein
MTGSCDDASDHRSPQQGYQKKRKNFNSLKDLVRCLPRPDGRMPGKKILVSFVVVKA